MSALTNEEWQDRAACRGPHFGLFYPPPETEKRNEKRVREDAAKKICQQCGVSQECLEHALEMGELHGVWGGTSEVERRHMIARRLSGGAG